MVTKAFDQLNANTTLAQLVRYAITGGGVTLLGGALYVGLVLATPLHPQLAMFAAYCVCVAVGYWLHSAWSFRGHGQRDNLARTTGRFVVVSLVSYGLNAFWTWFCIELLGLAEWTPVVPLLFVTPLATFALNRRWVFG